MTSSSKFASQWSFGILVAHVHRQVGCTKEAMPTSIIRVLLLTYLVTLLLIQALMMKGKAGTNNASNSHSNRRNPLQWFQYENDTSHTEWQAPAAKRPPSHGGNLAFYSCSHDIEHHGNGSIATLQFWQSNPDRALQYCNDQLTAGSEECWE